MPRSLLAFAVVFAALPALPTSDPPPLAAPHYEQIVVTGAWEPVPLEEADRSVRLLESDRIQLTLHSFADLLRLDASLDLRQRAPHGIQGDLSIRGATFGQTLVLLDGIRINDAQSGHHNLDLPVPLEALARVEILKGTGSTQYGSDAIGGVVHFVTRAPEASEFRLRAAAGNFGTNQQRGVLGFVRPNFSQQLYFSRDFSSGFIPNRDYRNLTLSSSTRYSSSLGAGALLLGFADKPFGADRFYGNFNSWERTKTWFAGARQALGDRTHLSLAYRRHTDLFVLYRHQPERFANHHALDTFVASARRRDPLSPNVSLHYGAEAYSDRIQSSNLGRHARARSAAYAALDVRALRRFSFNLGLRNELWGSLNSQLSPNLSFGLWLRPALKLKGALSHGFRIPSYTELYYHDPANRGSPNLLPERAWNYELGLEASPARSLRAELTLFHRRESNGIDFVRRSPADLWRATNIHRLRFTGVEAGLEKRFPRHTLDLRYTALHGAQSALPQLFSRYVFNYPRHAATVSWDALLPARLLARSRFGVTQRLGRNPYALWDCYLARPHGRLQPFFQLTNITATRYEEILGVPMPSRSWLGGIQIVVLSAGR